MPNISPYGDNAFGVSVKPLDYSHAHAPATKTYHGASIVVNGNIVGRIKSFQAAGAYTREGSHVYEVSHVTWGVPVDHVPGRSTGFNMSITRTEVWFEELEIAFGFPAVFNNLCDQTRPFTVYEYLFRGTALYRVWQYSGCWFTDKNPNSIEAEGDGKEEVTAQINYVSRIRIQ